MYHGRDQGNVSAEDDQLYRLRLQDDNVELAVAAAEDADVLNAVRRVARHHGQAVDVTNASNGGRDP
ncbi:MAG: hypothetical protein HFI92_02930 [Lachnospiraceae bacterium]|nr:hypothetical protein [Lachnospiraceae bacterium]